MKKLLLLMLSLALALGVVFTLASCGGDPEPPAETPDPVTVTLVLNGGSLKESFKTAYTTDDTITLPTKVNKSLESFAGWYTDEALTNKAGATVKPTAGGELKFYAKFVPQIDLEYYNLDNATVANPGKFTTGFAPGVDALVLPEVSMENEEFLGWFFDRDFTEPATEETLNALTYSARLFAKWGHKVTLTYNFDEGVPADNNYTTEIWIGNFDKAEVIVPTVSKTGFDFVGWYTDAAFTTPISVAGIKALEADTTVYARFGATINVTYSAGDSAIIISTDHTENFVSGDTGLKLAEVQSGVDEFLGWFFDDKYTQPATAEQLEEKTSDITLYAKWRPVFEASMETKDTTHQYSNAEPGDLGSVITANGNTITLTYIPIKGNPTTNVYDLTAKRATEWNTWDNLRVNPGKGAVNGDGAKYMLSVLYFYKNNIYIYQPVITDDDGNLCEDPNVTPIAAYDDVEKIDIVFTFEFTGDSATDGVMKWRYYLNGQDLGVERSGLARGSAADYYYQSYADNGMQRNSFWQYYNALNKYDVTHTVKIYPGDIYAE